MALSVINMNYIIGAKPLKNDNNIELMNEITIYLVALLMANFLNTRTPIYLADQLGWICIGIVISNMFINILITGFGILLMCLEKCRLHKAMKKFKKIESAKHENRKKLLKHFPEDAAFYRLQIDEEKAIKFIKSWHEQRQWLMAHKIDLSRFSEEKKYWEYISKFKMMPKAYIQRMNKSVKYLIVKQTHQQIMRQRIKANLD